MPLVNIKRKKYIRFGNVLTKNIRELRRLFAEHKASIFTPKFRKFILENMKDKIFGFQFEPVSAKLNRPNHNHGDDQDEPQKQPAKVFRKKWFS